MNTDIKKIGYAIANMLAQALNIWFYWNFIIGSIYEMATIPFIVMLLLVWVFNVFITNTYVSFSTMFNDFMKIEDDEEREIKLISFYYTSIRQHLFIVIIGAIYYALVLS